MKRMKITVVVLILLLIAMLTAIITSTVRGFQPEELVFRETESIVVPQGAVALREDGTLVSTDEMDLSMFSDVVQIVAVYDYVFGLHSDGTLVCDSAYFASTPAAQWRDVKKLVSTYDSSTGILACILEDGSVVKHTVAYCLTEFNGFSPEETAGYQSCDPSEIHDVKEIQGNEGNMYLLREDGKFVFWYYAQFDDQAEECYLLDVEHVADFEINPSAYYNGEVLCLLTDGSVTLVGPDEDNLSEQLASWQNIVQIEWGTGASAYGLRSDGLVLVAGKIDTYATPEENAAYAAEIASWENIVELDAYGDVVIALASDGRVYATGNNDNGECDVDDWRDVVGIQNYGSIVYGIRSDGTVLATGWNGYSRCEVSHWTDIRLPEGIE